MNPSDSLINGCYGDHVVVVFGGQPLLHANFKIGQVEGMCGGCSPTFMSILKVEKVLATEGADLTDLVDMRGRYLVFPLAQISHVVVTKKKKEPAPE